MPLFFMAKAQASPFCTLECPRPYEIQTGWRQYYLNQLQQYFQQYHKHMNMMLSFSQNSSTESQTLNSDQVSINKVKPWVFRPKKTIYSFSDSNNNKKTYSTSHWNDEENEKYVEFLIKFKDVIQGGKKDKRKWHLNRMMSKAIGTRSHEQCRSHHQKLIKHYKTLDGIIEHFSKNDVAAKSSEFYSKQNGALCPEKDEKQYESISLQEQPWNILQESVGRNLPFFYEEQPLI